MNYLFHCEWKMCFVQISFGVYNTPKKWKKKNRIHKRIKRQLNPNGESIMNLNLELMRVAFMYGKLFQQMMQPMSHGNKNVN